MVLLRSFIPSSPLSLIPFIPSSPPSLSSPLLLHLLHPFISSIPFIPFPFFYHFVPFIPSFPASLHSLHSLHPLNPLYTPLGAIITSFNFSSTGVDTASEEIQVPYDSIAKLCVNRENDCFLVIGVFGSHGVWSRQGSMEGSKGSIQGPIQGSIQGSIQGPIQGSMEGSGQRGEIADAASSQFSLVASFNGAVWLSNGQPVKGTASVGVWRYYKYTLFGAKEVSEVVGEVIDEWW